MGRNGSHKAICYENIGMLQNFHGLTSITADTCFKIDSQEKEKCGFIGPVYALESFFHKRIPIWKRAMDIVGSISCIIIFSPIMLAIACAIKLTSKGPVLFKQQRSGFGGKPFSFYKFRSMVVDAECMKNDLLEYNHREGPVFKMKDDPRITRIGNFIRKWSLDELPQLFNVMLGDMSLVGPRPPTLDEVARYEKWQDWRLEIKPGITCLWQIYARDDKSFDNWVRLDIEYIERRSLLLDMKILFNTVPAVLSCRGAC